MSYPKELKIALVREYEQGKTVAEISKSREIPENSIYRWIREYRTIDAVSYSFTPMATLKKYIPELLEREDFFGNTFYPEKNTKAA